MSSQRRVRLRVRSRVGVRLASNMADQKLPVQDTAVCMSELCKSDQSWKEWGSGAGSGLASHLQSSRSENLDAAGLAGGLVASWLSKRDMRMRESRLRPYYVVFLLQKRQSEILCTILKCFKRMGNKRSSVLLTQESRVSWAKKRLEVYRKKTEASGPLSFHERQEHASRTGPASR